MPLLIADTSKIWTVDDYQLIDDDIRCEIINGKLFMSPAPSSFHQIISSNLFYLLNVFIRKQDLGRVLCAPTDVYFDHINVYQPDLLVISTRNYDRIKERGVEGAPDLIVEIISPSNSYIDYHEKKETYERFGVLEYWIVDPANKNLEIFFLGSDKRYHLHAFACEDGVVSSKLLPEIKIDLKKVFE